MCVLIRVLDKKIQLLSPPVDISEVLEQVEDILDRSVAAEGYVIEPEEPIDLSGIDFEALEAAAAMLSAMGFTSASMCAPVWQRTPFTSATHRSRKESAFSNMPTAAVYPSTVNCYTGEPSPKRCCAKRRGVNLETGQPSMLIFTRGAVKLHHTAISALCTGRCSTNPPPTKSCICFNEKLFAPSSGVM